MNKPLVVITNEVFQETIALLSNECEVVANTAIEPWSREDRPRSIHSRLIEDRTLFSPHLGSAVAQARREIERDAAQNVLEVLAGLHPHGAVNRIGR